jgi:ribose transport system substrate-binding protein
MKLKHLATIGMAAVMTLSITGCGAATIDGETSGEKTESATSATSAAGGNEATGSGAIGLSISTMNNPFFVTLSEGAEAAAEELGADLVTVDAGDDTAKQASDIEDLISKNVSVLIVNPVDSDAVAPSVKDAIAAGIKVISVDRVVNGVDVDCAIASDNVKGAEMATQALLDAVGDGAKVAELQGVSGASATIDRGTGFHNVADSALEVVASQTANFNRSEGMSVMENILQANSDLVGVFAHNDEMALGAIEAIGDKDIKVVGFDATDDGVQAVKDGTMLATIAQQPDQMGKTAVETAQKLIKGETVEKTIPVEVTLVTSENVDSFAK